MITCPCPCYLLLSHMSLYIPRHSIRLIFMNKIYFVPNVHRVRDILNVKNILDPTMQSWLKTSILLCLLYCMWTMVYMHVGVGLLWKKRHVLCLCGFHMDHIMMTSSNGNIFRVTGHLCGKFTGPRWISHTKASDAELWCFLWITPE